MRIANMKYRSFGISLILLYSLNANAEDKHEDSHATASKKNADHDHGKEVDSHAELSEETVKQLGIPVMKAASGQVDNYLVMFGKIDLHPEKALHLHSKYPGVVHEVYKSIGDSVKAGTALARIENNVGVQTSDLVSTINGVVIEKKIAAGQSINEEIEAFTVADTSIVMATLVAYARDMNRIALGQNVTLQSSKSGPTESTTISYISPILDEKTRTGKVQFYLKNDGGLWRPGQFVVGKIQVGKRDVSVRIAKEIAHVSGLAPTKLYIKSENKFTQRPVVVSEGDSSFVEITSGLAPGEEYLGLELEKIEDLLKKKVLDTDAKK